MLQTIRCARRVRWSPAFTMAAAVALLVVSCGDPIVAPDDSSITLSAAPTSVSLTGKATITATVTSLGGGNVENGTAVDFSTTFGVLTTERSRTRGGKASTVLSGRGEAGTATVVARSGTVVSESIEVVIGGAVSVTLTVSPTSPAINQEVTFTATPSGSGPTVSRYEWNFGDPDRGSQNTRNTTTGSATYTYLTSGSKTVTVRAIGADGSSATAQVTFVVTEV